MGRRFHALATVALGFVLTGGDTAFRVIGAGRRANPCRLGTFSLDALVFLSADGDVAFGVLGAGVGASRRGILAGPT